MNRNREYDRSDDQQDGTPPVRDGAIWHNQGIEWHGWGGGWWTKEALPHAALDDMRRKEKQP